MMIRTDVYSTWIVLSALCLAILFGVSVNNVNAYGQSSYYNQGSYYGQGSYYSQGYYQASYYNQGTYYNQATYYSEASYGTVTLDGDVKFRGNVLVGSALSKGSGTFVIDHPLDPENKLLYHSFVESPDVKNIYDGVVTLNEAGEATVQLPEYFEALNDNYRYQVKGIGEPQPNLHIKEEVLNNSFVIGGGVAGAEVSWQVTGIRNDPFILANPVVVEVMKGPTALIGRGLFLFDDYLSWQP